MNQQIELSVMSGGRADQDGLEVPSSPYKIGVLRITGAQRNALGALDGLYLTQCGYQRGVGLR